MVFNLIALTSRRHAAALRIQGESFLLPDGFGKPVNIFFKRATLRCFSYGYRSAAPSFPPPHHSFHVWHLFLFFHSQLRFQKTWDFICSLNVLLWKSFFTARTEAQYETWAAVSQRQSEEGVKTTLQAQKQITCHALQPWSVSLVRPPFLQPTHPSLQQL